jgi:hypothetical protein
VKIGEYKQDRVNLETASDASLGIWLGLTYSINMQSTCLELSFKSAHCNKIGGTSIATQAGALKNGPAGQTGLGKGLAASFHNC